MAVATVARAEKQPTSKASSQKDSPSALRKSAPTTSPKPSPGMEVVDLATLDPSINIDIKWAGTDNMLGRRVYAENRCFLRRDAAERLVRVQQRLKSDGLGIKVWEGYRPLWMQQLLWDEIKDGDLISDPNNGKRTHTRGIAVDVTLIDLATGRELPMPTGYCEFSKREQMKQGYEHLAAPILRNRERLKTAMQAEGFVPYSGEWWHFNLPNYTDYRIIKQDAWVQRVP